MSDSAYDFGGMDAAEGEGWHNDLDAEVPEGLGEPFAWRIFVMPMKPLKKQGSIIIPEVSQQIGEYNTFVGRLAKIGKGAFQHHKYAEAGMGPEDMPKVGDYVIYSRATPFRFEFKGVKFLAMNDDSIQGVVPSPEGFKIHV